MSLPVPKKGAAFIKKYKLNIQVTTPLLIASVIKKIILTPSN